MKNIDAFKSFVRNKPSLINFVNNNEMTWQKFYEMWDLYGSDHEVWNKYNVSDSKNEVVAKSAASLSVADILATLRNVDTDTLQKGITGLQRGLNLLQEMFLKNNDSSSSNTNSSTSIPVRGQYSPRPTFRRFDD